MHLGRHFSSLAQPANPLLSLSSTAPAQLLSFPSHEPACRSACNSAAFTDDLGPLLSGSRPARFSVALVVPCSSSSPGWAGTHRKPWIPRGGGESVARATTAEFRAIFLNPSRPRILRIKSNASAFVPTAIRYPQASRSSPAMAMLLVLCTEPYCHYDFLISPHRAAVTLPLRFPLLAAATLGNPQIMLFGSLCVIWGIR